MIESTGASDCACIRGIGVFGVGRWQLRARRATLAHAGGNISSARRVADTATPIWILQGITVTTAQRFIFAIGLSICPACNQKPAAIMPAAPTAGPTAGAVPLAAAATPEQAAAAAAAPAAPNGAGFVRPTGPVALVNDLPIAAEKFNADFDKLTAKGARISSDRLQRIAKNILNKLIEGELRAQAIRSENIELTETEFEEAYKEHIARYVNQQGHFDQATMNAELQRTKMSVEELKTQVKEQRLAKKLIEKLGKIELSDADLKQFYDNNPSAWTESASRDVRPLLFRLTAEAPPSERKAAAAKAEAAYQALKKGGDFEQIAKENALEAMAPLHLSRGSGEGDVEKVAFELKVGEVSTPLTTRWGIYVLRLVEKNESHVRPYMEVREEIRQTLKSRKVYLEDRRIVNELRQKAKILELLKF